MPGSGTRTFSEADHLEASLRQTLIDTVVTPRGQFKARLTWAELHHMQLLRCEEDWPRIAFVSFAPRLAFVAFTAGSGPMPLWRGTRLQAGEIVLHSLGDRLHQSTAGPSIWSVITLTPVELENYATVLLGTPITLPPVVGQVLRPNARDLSRLKRLHAQACRLAETKPKILAHPEVARAIEQDLILALVECLSAAGVEVDRTATRRHASIMLRLEEVLAEHPARPLTLADLCDLLGVEERTLRSCCAEFLGISPSRYLLLRRLEEVRRALRDACSDKAHVGEIAGRYGFTQLGRFAGMYRAAFGETPSTTLRRAPQTRFSNT
jgi:AraC-like DNA-binding protein